MYSRQVLNDLSDMSIKQINDNFAGIFLKLSGNIDTLDLRDGAVKGDKIADQTITGNKILEGTLTLDNMVSDFVKGLDLLENTVFASYAESTDGTISIIQQNANALKLQVNNLSDGHDGLVGNFSDLTITVDGISTNVGNIQSSLNKAWTSINQNASSITLQSNRITETNSTVSRLSVSVNGISSDVASINRDLDSAWSSISQNSNNISVKVGKNDIISSINMSSERITIDSNRIDLRGVTTLYNTRGDSYIRFGSSSYGDFRAYANGYDFFEVYNNAPGVELRCDGRSFIRSDSNGKAYFPNGIDADVTAVFG